MKAFYKKYSFLMVKMFVNQCVISLFGNVLALCTASFNSTPITIAIGAFSILFYFFLNYSIIWEIGSKDSAPIDAGRMKYNPLTGLYIALGAAIPNLLLALIHAFCLPFAQSSPFLSGVCAITRIAMLFIEGMYTGIMSIITIGGVAINNSWWAYFVITIPMMAVAALAYILGRKNIHFTKVLLPMTPEELEIKRENKSKK